MCKKYLIRVPVHKDPAGELQGILPAPSPGVEGTPDPGGSTRNPSQGHCPPAGHWPVGEIAIN